MLNPLDITAARGIQAAPTARELAELREFVAERASRNVEALRLYEPTPFQQRFHECTLTERLLQAGNQVGKSLAAFAEDARAVTGQDPFGKYPKENGVLAIVGLDEAHIGKVVHRYLFKAGSFKIIRDKFTKQWRAWRPWMPEDKLRESEAKPAPPLIPHRFIKGGYSKGIAWVQKKRGIFAQVELTTGWVIYAFSSKGEPAAGFQADLVHIDEDIARPDWYDEMLARLTMRAGRLIWSALPLSKNDALVNLADRAEQEKIREANEAADDTIPPDKKFKAATAVFRATVWDNPFMPDEQRAKNIARWRATGEDEYRKRALGELVTDSYLMYPTFNIGIHEALPAKDREALLPVQQVLKDHEGVPPANWCRYTATDPGHTVCATLYAAVPPPELGEFVVIYDESYIQRCDAEMFGDDFQAKVKDQTIEEFLIDAHGGRLREIGSGETPMMRYEAQLRKRGLASVRTGHSFRPGSDDVKGRETILREWLAIRRDGTPKLLILSAKCPNLCFELSRFKKKVSALGIVTDDGDRRRYSHSVECFDPETEILTKSGWKPFPLLTDADDVATINPQTRLLEYQTPTAIVAREHSGEMVHFLGQSQNWLTTPNHRMVYARAEQDDGEWEFRAAGDVRPSGRLMICPAGWSGRTPDVVLVPRTATSDGRSLSLEKELDPGDFAEFLGWYMAEGSADATVRCPGKGYRVCMSQVKPEGIALLGPLLERLPWRFIKTTIGWVCSSKQLWEYLRPFGNKHQKYVPQWIKDASQETIRRFLMGYILGDGWHQNNRRRAYTVSRQLADGVQELILKLGAGANMLTIDKRGHATVRSNGRIITTKSIGYQVGELSLQYRSLRQANGNPTFKTVKYEGMVHCATVPNGTLIVRRGGMPLVAGNCVEYLAAHGLPYRKPPQRVRSENWLARYLRERDLRAAARAAKGYGLAPASYISLGPQGALS